MSHYIPGRIADILTAIGIIAGMTWGLISFKRDWRARFLLVSYAVLVFFVGAIVQYNNPPNTRLYFLMPLLCVIGAVGLSRLLAVVSKFKHAYKKYKAARLFTACALVVICLLNFFLYFPKVFQFTPEALIARYALNEGKKKNIVVVTDKYFMISQVAALYKFDGRLERISAADIQTRVESDYMRNKVMILGDDLIGVRQGLRAYLKPGTVIMDGMGRESAYIFDFTDDQYYRGFVDLWKTNAAFVLGAQPTQGQEFNKPAAYSAPAVQAPTKPEIKPVTFSTAGGPCKTKQIPPFVPMTNAKFTFIKMYDVGAVTPSDIAVVPDGSRIFIVDGEGYKLFIYNRAGNTYKVYKKLSLSSKKGLLGMVDDRKQEQKEHAYIQYDASNNCLYILDGGKDTIKKYDLEGNFIKIITTSPFLHGARSMRLSHDGVFAISLTGRNMIQFTDVNGADRGNYYTPYGNNCGQLNQPCFVGFDSNLNRYVVDTLNSRVQVFSTAMKYMGNYGIGMSSTILGPQIVINEKVPLPYMAVTMQYTRSVLFIPLGKGTPKTLELKGESDISFTGPSPIAQDANGDIYIVDSRTKVLVKVTIPQNPMQ
jgi:DNA-binding beta-propeller fold protein YncE